MQQTKNAMDYNGERNNEQRLQWTKNAIEKECNEQKNPGPMITMNKEIECSGQRIQRKKKAMDKGCKGKNAMNKQQNGQRRVYNKNKHEQTYNLLLTSTKNTIDK